MTAAAPSGVVTFLFTDIEGSTRRWEADADAMRAALLDHDEVLRTTIESHGGFMFSAPITVSLLHPLPGTPPSATTAYREDDHSGHADELPSRR